MSDVTGPISTLPGCGHVVPDGQMCDEHPDRPAIARIQGETDSFGCEMIDCCAECRDQLRQELREGRGGTCDRCHTHAERLSDTRDDEEGPRGPVYRYCDACIRQRDRRLAAEYGDGWQYD